MDNKAVITTEYLPPVSSIALFHHIENVHIEAKENYQKKSTRNRAKILGTNGLVILSVPLQKGKNSRTPISEVNISYDTQWIGNHLHAIKSAYGNAPYFDFYYDDIASILKSNHETLLALNTALLSYFLTAIDIDNEVKFTEEYHVSFDPKVIDLRKTSFGKEREIASIKYKRYNQVFEEKHGFVKDLSILDLLMCKGPESILYL